jgi:hypothetical protein
MHITPLEIASGIGIFLAGVVSGLFLAAKLWSRSPTGDNR